jgi:hypothetical protein
MREGTGMSLLTQAIDSIEALGRDMARGALPGACGLALT